jgi:Flp pilus assembly protein TadD
LILQRLIAFRKVCSLRAVLALSGKTAIRQSQAALRQGNGDSAQQYAVRALEQSPKSAEAKIALAQALIKLERSAEAASMMT